MCSYCVFLSCAIFCLMYVMHNTHACISRFKSRSACTHIHTVCSIFSLYLLITCMLYIVYAFSYLLYEQRLLRFERFIFQSTLLREQITLQCNIRIIIKRLQSELMSFFIYKEFRNSIQREKY